MGGDWKRLSWHWNRIFIAVGVFPLELVYYLVGRMTSSVISFAYFILFLNTDISGTNADVCKL